MKSFGEMLDEMMGKDRNKLHKQKPKKIDLKDRKYCPYFLVEFCPYDLFFNTRADLGECSKKHDKEARKAWQKESRKYRYDYEERLYNFCKKIMEDLERKMDKARRKLIENNQAEEQMAKLNAQDPAAAAAAADQLRTLNDRIVELSQKMEELGEEGEIEEAEEVLKLIDQLKAEKEALDIGTQVTTHIGPVLNEDGLKYMRVCETCGSLLVIGDIEKRIQAHVEGRLHLGYFTVRDALPRLEKAVKERKKERRERDRKRRDRSKDRDRKKSSKSRSRRSKERDRKRDRSKDKDRSKDRDRRKRRDRSKDRDRRRSSKSSRKRSRSRSKSKEKKSKKEGNSNVEEDNNIIANQDDNSEADKPLILNNNNKTDPMDPSNF